MVIPATAKVFGQLVHCPAMADAVRLRPISSTSSSSTTGGAHMGHSNAVDPSTATVAGSHASVLQGTAAHVMQALARLDAEACSSHLLGQAAGRGSSKNASGAELYDVREMHVDMLWPLQEVQPLSQAFEVFDFDWAQPVSARRISVQVRGAGTYVFNEFWGKGATLQISSKGMTQSAEGSEAWHGMQHCKACLPSIGII